MQFSPFSPSPYFYAQCIHALCMYQLINFEFLPNGHGSCKAHALRVLGEDRVLVDHEVQHLEQEVAVLSVLCYQISAGQNYFSIKFFSNKVYCQKGDIHTI